MSSMNRNEYRKARQLIRENGYYALRWMNQRAAETMTTLRDINNQSDPLAERASIIAYCARVGAGCNVRYTQQAPRFFFSPEAAALEDADYQTIPR